MQKHAHTKTLNALHVETMLSQVQSRARVSLFLCEEAYSTLENAFMIRPKCAE